MPDSYRVPTERHTRFCYVAHYSVFLTVFVSVFLPVFCSVFLTVFIIVFLSLLIIVFLSVFLSAFFSVYLSVKAQSGFCPSVSPSRWRSYTHYPEGPSHTCRANKKTEQDTQTKQRQRTL